MMEKYVVITGGTGLIGKALVKELSKKSYKIILLARREISTLDGVEVSSILWDSEKPSDIKEEIEKLTNGSSFILINLAGYPIAKSRWTNEVMYKILNSRINGTEYLANDLCGEDSKVSLLVSASAVGYYGDVDYDVDEDAESGSGFLSDVCEKWEKATAFSQVDTKIIRIGVVLSEGGGALEKMKQPYKYFVGGPIGSGRQYVPWIHIEDLVYAIIHIIEKKPEPDVFNMVAPEHKTMKEFSEELSNALNRPNMFPVPAFILKLLMGEMSSMVLEGQKVIPKNLLKSYSYKYSNLKSALDSLL